MFVATKSWGQNSFAEWIIVNLEESGHRNDETADCGVYFIAQLSTLIYILNYSDFFYYLLSEWSVQLIWKKYL